MTDTIVYVAYTKAGGIDGRDHTSKGGAPVAAALDRATLENSPNAPWQDILPEIVDLERLRKSAIASMDPVVKLALGL